LSKKLYSILLALIPMLSIAVATVSVEAADPSDWYMTVNGVLSSDYYSLYPYKDDKSLKIGFSKYGELINSNENVGLEYGAVDPFAPPAGSSVGSIRKVMWVQGWLLNVTYLHNTKGWRNVWAAALFSDSTQYGNDWIRVDFFGDKDLTFGWEDPRDPGWYIGNYAAGGMKYGGRKTNGTCVTEPIKVLYDGPREFVALLTTTVWDHPVYQTDDTSADIPLVKVMITIIFNKVKKEVKLLKDIKSLISEKDAYQIKVQFSNRGEVDLGTETSGYHSYFHFYTEGLAPCDSMVEGLPTVYNSEWEILKTEVPKDEREPLKYQCMSAAGPFPQDDDATFDVAQAINPTAGYVWWGAFWPSLSDWSIDGWSEWWRSLEANDPHYIDAAGYSDPSLPREQKIPFYIGEWDFVLEAVEFAPKVEFRGVTVYGITDRNNANDANMVSGSNVIDKETLYQLDEVFNPWDLNSAVHKKTSRYVKFVPGSYSGSITLSPPPL
jgi:hypothetical protein